MTVRYLFGPVDLRFAKERLGNERRAGRCLAFGRDGVDIIISPDERWEDVVSRFPADWQPDLVVLWLSHFAIPASLWQAPLPTVALAGDWHLHWHGYRELLPFCEGFLSDESGVGKLAGAGLTDGRAAFVSGSDISALLELSTTVKRDIDILLADDVHISVQGDRLWWVAPLAQLARRWHIEISADIGSTEYRQLLQRARIVVNRSFCGVWNERAADAFAAGALLFQEEGDHEAAARLRDRHDCVFYREDNLEKLLHYYLSHEEERQAVAANGHSRAAEFTFASLWEKQLEAIEDELPALRARRAKRPEATWRRTVRARLWQALSATTACDSILQEDLHSALVENPSAELHNAAGVLAGMGPDGAKKAALAVAATEFQTAWLTDPRLAMSGLNLAEVLLAMGRKDEAAEQVRRTLAVLRSGDLHASNLSAPHFPPIFDLFRVEWERAAWQQTGTGDAESRSKLVLLRWRLQQILAEVTGGLVHHYEAAALRPDFPATQAALGCALVRHQFVAEGVFHLRRALNANPFDPETARTLFHALATIGDIEAHKRVATDWRLLVEVAPNIVRDESWAHLGDLVPLTSSPPMTMPWRVVWEGEFTPVHSLALVNREVCRRLRDRKHQLALVPSRPSEEVNEWPADLQECRVPAGPVDVHIRHFWPPRFERPPAEAFVIMQQWEFGSLPRAWVEPLSRRVDEVWVASRFVRNSFISSGVPEDKVHVIPLGVSPDMLGDRTRLFPLRTVKPYKFLFVGGTINRKGIDLLLSAFGQVFSARDGVCLVIKDMGGDSFYRGQTAAKQIEEFRHKPHAPEIEHIERELSPPELASLYATCNCLVHPYRGEGFGLPIVEAMANGLPVIVTGAGPSLDYCTDRNAYLIPARAVPFTDKRVGDLDTVNHPWLYQPDGDFLRLFLRQAYEEPDAALERGQAAAETILSRFTWNHTVDAIEQRLNALMMRRYEAAPTVARAAPQSSPKMAVQKATISLCMIVKNEEANIEECLRSAAGLVDEVIVVDTGSTDRTKELARQNGARLFDFPWIDSFAAARNEGLRHATGDWVFWLDADDRIDAANRQRLKTLCERLDPRAAGYIMKCLCLPDPHTGTATIVDHVRLFRRHPEIRWTYRVHEQILPALRKVAGEILWSDVVIHHTGYLDPVLRGRKLERDVRLLGLEDQEHPNDPFTLFNLGSIYHELGRVDEAITFLRRSLDGSNPQASIVRKLYALLAQCHRQLGRVSDALSVCLEGRRHYPADAELLFQEALARRELRDLTGAETCLLQVLDTKDEKHFASIDTGLRGYKARHNLAVICSELQRFKDAEEHWRAALEERSDFTPAWLGLADMFVRQERWNDVDALASRLENHASTRLEGAVLRARRLAGEKDYRRAQERLEELIKQHPQAVLPRVILTHVLLQEGKWPAAAERALRAVLELAPEHAESKRNLAALLNASRPT